MLGAVFPPPLVPVARLAAAGPGADQAGGAAAIRRGGADAVAPGPPLPVRGAPAVSGHPPVRVASADGPVTDRSRFSLIAASPSQLGVVGPAGFPPLSSPRASLPGSAAVLITGAAARSQRRAQWPRTAPTPATPPRIGALGALTAPPASQTTAPAPLSVAAAPDGGTTNAGSRRAALARAPVAVHRPRPARHGRAGAVTAACTGAPSLAPSTGRPAAAAADSPFLTLGPPAASRQTPSSLSSRQVLKAPPVVSTGPPRRPTYSSTGGTGRMPAAAAARPAGVADPDGPCATAPSRAVRAPPCPAAPRHATRLLTPAEATSVVARPVDRHARDPAAEASATGRASRPFHCSSGASRPPPAPPVPTPVPAVPSSAALGTDARRASACPPSPAPTALPSAAPREPPACRRPTQAALAAGRTGSSSAPPPADAATTGAPTVSTSCAGARARRAARPLPAAAAPGQRTTPAPAAPAPLGAASSAAVAPPLSAPAGPAAGPPHADPGRAPPAARPPAEAVGAAPPVRSSTAARPSDPPLPAVAAPVRRGAPAQAAPAPRGAAASAAVAPSFSAPSVPAAVWPLGAPCGASRAARPLAEAVGAAPRVRPFTAARPPASSAVHPAHPPPLGAGASGARPAGCPPARGPAS